MNSGLNTCVYDSRGKSGDHVFGALGSYLKSSLESVCNVRRDAIVRIWLIIRSIVLYCTYTSRTKQNRFQASPLWA